MTRDQLEDLLIWCGIALRNGMPSAWPTENTLAKAQSVSARGTARHVVPNFIPVMPSRLASLMRAIKDRLDPDEQATVEALYVSDARTLQQKASLLGIKVAALKVRRRKIHVKLLHWFSPGGHALRRLADEAHEARALEAARAAVDADRERDTRLRDQVISARQARGLPAYGPRQARRA